MDAGLGELWSQFSVLNKKNFILALRSWKTTSLQILAPLAFLVMLLILQVMPRNDFYADSNPPVKPISTIPRCIPYSSDTCYSLVYAPNNLPKVQPLIEYIAKESGLEISDYGVDAKPYSILGFNSSVAIVDWLWENQNVTQGALVFYSNNSYTDDTHFTFDVMFNSSCLQFQATFGASCPDIRYAVQHMAQAAFTANITNSLGIASSITASRQSYPIVPMSSKLNDTVSSYGILFFYCGLMFNFIILVYQLVTEKEKKLKEGLKLMGMKASMYWMSWFVYGLLMTFLASMLMILGGYACMFPFFLDTNFFVLFLVFFLFGISMMMLAFLLSALITTSKGAISAGMFLFIVGVFVQMLLTQPQFVEFLYFDIIGARIIRRILIFYPPFNFAKAVYDIIQLSFDYGDYKGAGYHWSDLFNWSPSSDGITLPPTIQSLELLLMNMAIFGVLSWYVENIQTFEFPRSIFFFLTKEYWGLQSVIPSAIPVGPLQRSNEPAESLDIDIKNEDERAINDLNPEGVKIIRLSKTYRKSVFCASAGDNLALDNLSLNIEPGTLFCLLGHNGAGKTTSINIMTGLFGPTSGDAFVFNKSILTEMTAIRRSMGVCPQHDVLWNELTAREHLDIFVRLKKIPRHMRKQLIDEKLESVKLLDVGNNRVGSFSGGMKRRLSVAISSIGDPEIIFMDEPTTGMDPMSRRHVWDLIQRMKKDRVIILTTHSMEEADILADRIGIMAQGKLRCVGDSLHLKNRFGTGYRLTVAVQNVEHVAAIQYEVKKLMPEVEIQDVSGTSIYFGVALRNVDKLSTVLAFLEAELDQEFPRIQDFGVSLSTLEDVFLSITRQFYSGGRLLGKGVIDLS